MQYFYLGKKKKVVLCISSSVIIFAFVAPENVFLVNIFVVVQDFSVAE